MRLGQLLVKDGIITDEQLNTALQIQTRFGGRIGTSLIEMGVVDADAIARALSKQHGVPPVLQKHLSSIDPGALKLLPARLAEHFGAIPLGNSARSPHRLIVAFRDPTMKNIEDVGFATSKRIEPGVTSELLIAKLLERFYGVKRKVAVPYVQADLGPAMDDAPRAIEARSAQARPMTQPAQGGGQRRAAPAAYRPTTDPSVGAPEPTRQGGRQPPQVTVVNAGPAPTGPRPMIRPPVEVEPGYMPPSQRGPRFASLPPSLAHLAPSSQPASAAPVAAYGSMPVDYTPVRMPARIDEAGAPAKPRARVEQAAPVVVTDRDDAPLARGPSAAGGQAPDARRAPRPQSPAQPPVAAAASPQTPRAVDVAAFLPQLAPQSSPQSDAEPVSAPVSAPPAAQRSVQRRLLRADDTGAPLSAPSSRRSNDAIPPPMMPPDDEPPAPTSAPISAPPPYKHLRSPDSAPPASGPSSPPVAVPVSSRRAFAGPSITIDIPADSIPSISPPPDPQAVVVGQIWQVDSRPMVMPTITGAAQAKPMIVVPAAPPLAPVADSAPPADAPLPLPDLPSMPPAMSAAPKIPSIPPPPIAHAAEGRVALGINDAVTRIAAARTRDEVGDAIVDYLRSAYGCGLVLIVREELALGWKGFSEAADDTLVEAISLPLGPASMLNVAYQSQAAFRGAPPHEGTPLHSRLWKLLRVTAPREVIVAPILLRERVVNLVYAHAYDGGVLATRATSDMLRVCSAAADGYLSVLRKK